MEILNSNMNKEINKTKSLSVHNLEYFLPNGEKLFSDINFSINKEDRIVLIGKNGSGKSTLMKIISGKISPSSGSIEGPNNIKYLSQMDENTKEKGQQTILELLSSVDNDWWEIQMNYEKIFAQKLPPVESQIGNLSGGEYMRLKIAIATYQNPEILLLDEPTNHLDIDAKEILKKFIDDFQGGVMIVSHDVHFINQVARSIIELNDGKIKQFGGDYQDYLTILDNESNARERRLSDAEQEIRKAKKNAEKEQKRASRSKRAGKEAIGSMSTIERGFFKNKASKSAGQGYEKAQEKIKEAKKKVDENTVEKKKMARISIQENENNPHKKLLEINSGTLTVNGKKLIDNINLSIRSGDRIALAGKNGSGKTCLISALIGTESNNVKLSGNISFAENLSTLYLSQKYEQVIPEKSLLDNVLDANPGITMQIARQSLGNLLFTDTYKVKRPAKTLSGGETARLAFAMASISAIDILVLDEPTNNLDIDTINVITKALEQFNGAILAVSHDIQFLSDIDINKTYKIIHEKLVEMKNLPSDTDYYNELLSK